MTWRAAIVASTRQDLLTGLRELLEIADSGNGPEGASIPLFIGESAEDSNTSALLSGKIGETVSQLLLEEKNMENIAMYWTQGGRISWEALHEDKDVRRIPLPITQF
ncbi:Polyketide synthase PksR [compost metagenome]